MTKRYTAESVLKELVTFAEGVVPSGEEARRLLTRVLRADTGFVVVSVPKVDALNVIQFRTDLREFLRTGLTPNTGQLMPSADVQVSATVVGRSVLVTIDGKPRDLVWFQVVRLMQLEGLDKIHACECGRVFLRTGRREFCTPRCQKRYYMRRFRSGNAGKE